MRESRIFVGEKAPLLFGHRGCPVEAPENTLASFSRILENNIPGVELDVQVCSSGELVVLHDNNMLRTTGFDGNILDHDLTQIRSLDNGSFFSPDFKGEKIPLLEEVFQLLGDKVYYDIELKADYTRSFGLEKKVLAMIRDFRLTRRVVVSSFNPLPVARFKKLTNEIPAFLIYSDTEDVPFYLRKGEGRFLCRPEGLKPDCRLLDENLYRKLSRKYLLMSWTVNDLKTYNRLAEWEIDGVCSNYAADFVSGS
ncbi:glycerophosphodiester phosphodiesterase [Spirochaeta isovalerica]|uniref:Glycerophosphoryl diester phosphodiesterase n=1 Tax=Spirochaeta isovalerica TaxID=150 RepID=A0A841REX0_9SPIO|nr:glycerophosphodiester phosphodiesterase family protein [Spirochaeta isovalerica]MBB6482625.1 glycerophosphoryl diester phosphodiesterase [Spirochaeta isovalerica]